MPQRKKTKKFFSIILIILGSILFLYSFISHIRLAEFYLDSPFYDNVFSYFFAAILGRLGWGMHFGITLVLIGIYLLKEKGTDAFTGSAMIAEDYGSGNGTVHDTSAHNYAQPSTIQQGMARPYPQKDMSVVDWLIVLLLTAIPVVNIIMLLVWAFGGDDPKKNYARAALIYVAASIFLSLIIFVLFTLPLLMYL